MKIFSDAVCPGCTLLCDDVKFEINRGKIQSDVQCSKAQRWIELVNDADSDFQATGTGEYASEKTAATIECIATTLQTAKQPVVAGLKHLTTQGQQQAWRIADRVGAHIDVALTPNSQGSLYALQRQGKVSATLGEVRQRSDLLVFWFCNPLVSHPRLMQRLKASGKTVIVIDNQRTETASAAHQFIEANASQANELIQQARAQLGKLEVDTGAPALDRRARQLIKALTDCNYGCWFYGHVDDATRDDALTLAHQKLVRQLNDHTRFVSLGLRDDQNAQSAENVLAAFSGYPQSVSLGRGHASYCGDLFSAATALHNGACDYLLLFAGLELERNLEELDKQTRDHFLNTPKAIVHCGNLNSSTELGDADLVNVGAPGGSASGEYCRIDDVSLALSVLRPNQRPSGTEVLDLIWQALN